MRNKDRQDELTHAAVWMVLTRDLDFMKELTASFLPLQDAGEIKLVNQPREDHQRVRAWTDKRSNLFQILW